MAKSKEEIKIIKATKKHTSIGDGLKKTSSMNKSTARSFKPYRGQGRGR
jgi:hypothetical protein